MTSCTPYIDMNQFYDTNKLQGVTHPFDTSIPRDLNTRWVSIENSSLRPIGIAIVNYYSGPTPVMTKLMRPGEVFNASINTVDMPDQFIHILNPDNGLPVSYPTILDRMSNQFVLRDGLNLWFVQKYRRSSYKIF